ncbi:transcriptional regulator [Endozoicomonas sp. OPT23]|uniref:helix-turn-helix domain-containing protein n=1 Tax=Endozoicomonas sp. OPT23 TaxID=2072845 RepID=UPI00129BA1DF|nr:XRE family transcriptional regulator [Endozoicomonas sp. OPT23]MRI35288.1 transcriptional regulator [Endozoicomonas sp. OPT23]
MSEHTDFLKDEQVKIKIERRNPAKNKADATVEPLQLGQRVREIRKTRNLTLEEVSKLTGLSRSAISKIENDQISPTFAAVTKLVNGLGIDIPQLFSPAKKKSAAVGRRDVTLKGTGKLHPTKTYEHELLAAELTGKRMVPYRTTVCARSFNDYEEWVRHEGEEFLLVLSGSIELYTEFYQPVELQEGDSAYYDAEMGHAVISTSEEDAVILWVTA